MSYAYRHESKPPRQEDVDAWRQELASFDFPDFSHPPVDAWEYVLAEYKKVRGFHQNDSVRPDEYYSLMTISHGFIAWLFSKGGSEWLLQMFGIEEVDSHHGYRYYFEDHLIGPETNSSIRIFIKHSTHRFQEPANEMPGAVDEMKRILVGFYKSRSKTPMYASDGMWTWALTALRNWFTEPVDKQWPTVKADRINGIQWARNRLDPWGNGKDPMWSTLSHTETYRPRAYRIEQEGGVMWCGRTKIRTQALDEFLYNEGVRGIRDGVVNMSESKLSDRVQEDFTCESCGRVICCVDSGRGSRGEGEKLCDSCFGTQVESGHRLTLDNCTYSECYQCPNYIRNSADLSNLKHKLGQDYSFPVRR